MSSRLKSRLEKIENRRTGPGANRVLCVLEGTQKSSDTAILWLGGYPPPSFDPAKALAARFSPLPGRYMVVKAWADDASWENALCSHQAKLTGRLNEMHAEQDRRNAGLKHVDSVRNAIKNNPSLKDDEFWLERMVKTMPVS